MKMMKYLMIALSFVTLVLVFMNIHIKENTNEYLYQKIGKSFSTNEIVFQEELYGDKIMIQQKGEQVILYVNGNKEEKYVNQEKNIMLVYDRNNRYECFMNHEAIEPIQRMETSKGLGALYELSLENEIIVHDKVLDESEILKSQNFLLGK